MGRRMSSGQHGVKDGQHRLPARWQRLWVVLMAASLVGLALLLRPLSVGASCAEGVSLQEAIRSSPTIFVGTVSSVSDQGRRARVHVDDVWKGINLPADVEVIGTPDLSAAATDVDRAFTTSQQYLFLPTAGGPQNFQDNSCTQTQPYSQALLSLRPSGAPGAPASQASSGLSPSLSAAIILAVPAAVLCAIALTVRRKGRRGPAPATFPGSIR